MAGPSGDLLLLWASIRIRKIAGCACAGNSRKFFPAPVVSYFVILCCGLVLAGLPVLCKVAWLMLRAIIQLYQCWLRNPEFSTPHPNPNPTHGPFLIVSCSGMLLIYIYICVCVGSLFLVKVGYIYHMCCCGASYSLWCYHDVITEQPYMRSHMSLSFIHAVRPRKGGSLKVTFLMNGSGSQSR